MVGGGKRGAAERGGRWRWRDRDREAGREVYRGGQKQAEEKTVVVGGKEARGKAVGSRLEGRPGGWGVGTHSALCFCGEGWVRAQKPAGVHPTRRSGREPASVSSPSGTCTGISSSTQGECSSRPIKMHRNVSGFPSLPGSCQHHASSLRD